MVDTLKLRGKIVEHQKTQESLADAIGMARSTFYRKMKNGGKGFTVKEVNLIISEIPLTKDEAVQIFFA